MRRFYLDRVVDVSGSSGTGVVAEGVEFAGGICVLHWLTQYQSVAVYESAADLIAIHGHDGASTLRWVDAPEPPLIEMVETTVGRFEAIP